MFGTTGLVWYREDSGVEGVHYTGVPLVLQTCYLLFLRFECFRIDRWKQL